jgi:hypothetical protein
MSGMKDKLWPRGTLSVLATFALVVAIVVAVPGISGARAAVKQFLATMSPTTATGNTASSWTETVTNCGPASAAPCTASSTIGLGTIQISVPSEFRPITSLSASSPNGRNWTVSYDSAAGKINAYATQGSDKLQPGEVVNITFGATPSTCDAGTKTFTTLAWGSTPLPGSDLFTLKSPSQPSIQIAGCNLAPGNDMTGPNGTNVTNDSDVTVGVSFGGTLTCDSSQWASYQLPDEVNITPPAHPGLNPKAFIFKFDDAGAADSSFYLICYDNGSGGAILPHCYPGGGDPINPPPCVDQQYRDFDDPIHPVVIRIIVPPEDPRAH